MKNTILLARFDELVDALQEAVRQHDSLQVYNVNQEAYKFWQHFLAAGFDATQVANLLSVKHRLENYNKLVLAGARIDVPELFKKAPASFAEKHWREFAECGISSDELARKCYLGKLNDFVMGMLSRGVSVDLTFALHESKFVVRKDEPDELYKDFQILVQYGMQVDYIHAFFKKHATRETVADIVERPGRWKALGLDLEPFISRYIETTHVSYIENLGDLPKSIPLRRFVEGIDLDEFVDAEFIDDYIDAGGDVDDLAATYVAQYGYTEYNFDVMLELLDAGSTVIDITAMVNSVADGIYLGPADLTRACDIMHRAGASKGLIERFHNKTLRKGE